MKTKGLICEIYRWSLGDCSNNGISSRCNSVVLIDASGPFEPSVNQPAVKLVRRMIDGKEYVHAEPVEPCPSNRVGYMSGGTFIRGDSRFNEAVGHSYPIALHDRTE